MKESEYYKRAIIESNKKEQEILIEAKQRRIKEAKEDVVYLENRLAMAKDRLMIYENELKELI